MRVFFTNFWIKAQTSPSFEMTPAFAQCLMKCYHVSQSQVFSSNLFHLEFHRPLSQKKLSRVCFYLGDQGMTVNSPLLGAPSLR